MASLRSSLGSGTSLRSSLGSGTSLRNATQRRQPEIKIKEVKMKPHLSGVEREERYQQRLNDAKVDRKIARAAREADAERSSNVTNYSKVGKEYMDRFARAELEDQWRKKEKNYMSDLGRVKIEVKNSLQMELRNIEKRLDHIVAKYSKKYSNPHISQGIQKLRNNLEDTIEKALRELMWYTIEEEHKQNAELIPLVSQHISKAEEEIGYYLDEKSTTRLIKEVVTAIIQGSVDKTKLEQFIYNKVDYYSRIVQ